LRLSSCDFAHLQDAPGLELGIDTLARGAEPGMGTVGVILEGGLVSAR
jgi:hypothetical protein